MPKNRQTFTKRLFQWRFFFVVNIIIILFFSFTLGRELLRSHDVQQDIQALQSEADALAVKNIAMNELHTAIQTKSFIEREARLKLGMKKPGESVIIVQDNDLKKEEMDSAIEQDKSDPLGLVLDGHASKEELANSSKWWYYFFNKSAYRTIREYEN